MGFRVQIAASQTGLRVFMDSGFWVYGLGFWVVGSGFRVRV